MTACSPTGDRWEDRILSVALSGSTLFERACKGASPRRGPGKECLSTRAQARRPWRVRYSTGLGRWEGVGNWPCSPWAWWELRPTGSLFGEDLARAIPVSFVECVVLVSRACTGAGKHTCVSGPRP